jgi:diguanylate cyclase (GGDEF)-like protein
MHDVLTGLYNRRYMEDSLERETHRAQRYNGHIGIIMIDIDHFKLFNDLHGHKVGDLVLRELGKFLKENVRGEDIACRYGGEEFMLILPNASLESSRLRAEELRCGVKSLKILHKDQEFRISISAGVAALPDHSSNIREVVDHSDLALYQAKSKGRDQIAVAPF